jgi:very-short-patch-repair endonuclease
LCETPPCNPPRGGIYSELTSIIVGMYVRKKELVKKARDLRNHSTKAEIILWSRLRLRQIDGFKFRRQQPVFDYIADFYCPELKLIIELDGVVHNFKETLIHDAKRDNILRINGYHIIRIPNSEIETDLNSSINKIRSFITEIMSPSQGDHRGFSK